MEETLLVKAPEGKFCPMERSRDRITDKEFVSVPNTAFYRRMIAEKSLLVRAEEKTAPEPVPTVPKSPTKKTKGGNS